MIDLDGLNRELSSASPHEILIWTWSTFEEKVAVTSSFQTQSVPLLHLISKSVPELPIIFLDTGFHFPETLVFRDSLIKEWGLNVNVVKSKLGHDGFKAQYGELFRRNPDLCCYINKVEPLETALGEYKAWLSGIRSDQTQFRKDTPIVLQMPNGKYKISPLANWTDKDIWTYIHDFQLPEHPLFSQGYLSIGCAPCTNPVFGGDDPRAGRWPGMNKTECGLHVNIKNERDSV